jgi:hypothetical protein
MEIQYHNWRATCILAVSREVKFEFELIWIGVDFQEDGPFRAQGLTSWPRIIKLFFEDLHKHGNGNKIIDWPNHLHLEWEYKSTQPTHGQSELFWPTLQAFAYDGTACPIYLNRYGLKGGGFWAHVPTCTILNASFPSWCNVSIVCCVEHHFISNCMQCST